MLEYTVKRLGYISLVLLVLSLVVFAITQILPGNVANIIAGQFAPADVIAAVEVRLGLDQPWWKQYSDWLLDLANGDLGSSIVMERSVGPLIWEALSRSATLAVTSFLLVAVIGILLGVLGAINYNNPIDHAAAVISYLGISVPEFFWGIVLVLIFSRQLGWFPSGGYVPIEDGFSLWVTHLVLPAATLTITLIAHVARMTRSSMLETLKSQYIRAARAKGLPKHVILFRHVLPNALLPTITILAIDVGWLIGGIVVVESVFSYPGLGRLLMFAIERHDIPLIQGSILIIAAIYCLANLCADLLYAYFNPKIRFGGPNA